MTKRDITVIAKTVAGTFLAGLAFVGMLKGVELGWAAGMLTGWLISSALRDMKEDGADLDRELNETVG